MSTEKKEKKAIIAELAASVNLLVSHDTPEGVLVWEQLIDLHPADIADFFSLIDHDEIKSIFIQFTPDLQLEVFSHVSDSMKVFLLSCLDDVHKASLLAKTPIDELTDLFDSLSDQELKKYLILLSTQDRQKVLSLMKFDPESAGGIMDTDVLTFLQSFTVEKSIQILQRLQPRRELHQQMYVTDQDNILVGYINLEDLVLQSPKERLSNFLHEVELIVDVQEDREEVAKKMVHYELMTAPVVGENNYFLGVISSDILVEVLVEEAGEDVTRMASLPTIKEPYFELSFAKLLYLRGYVLLALLIAESFSGNIIRAYEATMTGILISFIPMLTSAGGNTGSQTSAVVIQGMASGEIGFFNMARFLRREFYVSLTIALIMAVYSFARSYSVGGTVPESLAICSALGAIVFISAMLGSVIPFVLRRFNIDPAFSAGPFLATLMDILGIVIYCYISKLILFS
ncbi:MAG: magnesium transporter [Candidatus Babeliales bacterium]